MELLLIIGMMLLVIAVWWAYGGVGPQKPMSERVRKLQGMAVVCGKYLLMSTKQGCSWTKHGGAQMPKTEKPYVDENGNVYYNKNQFVNAQRGMGKTEAEIDVAIKKAEGRINEAETMLGLFYAGYRRFLWKAIRVLRTVLWVRYERYWKYNRGLNKAIPRVYRNAFVLSFIVCTVSLVIPYAIFMIGPAIGMAIHHETQEFYVEDFRQSGDTDAQTIQAALTGSHNLQAMVGGPEHVTVVFEAGRLYNTAATTMAVYTEQTLKGLKSKMTHNTGIDIFKTYGSATVDIPVNANYDAWQSTAILTGVGHGLANRGFLLAYDDTLKFPASTVKQGEIVEIQGAPVEAGTTTVTIKEQFLYSYTVANNANVRPINFVEHVYIEDFDFLGVDEFTDTGSAIEWLYTKDSRITNCTFLDFGERSTMVVGGYSIKISLCNFNYSNNNANGYGISCADAGRDIQVIGCSFTSCKHGVTHGGGVSGLGWIQESSVADSEFINSSYDCHPEVGESLQISNCFIMFRTSVGGSRGMALRGGRVAITNCTIYGAQTDGIRCEGYCLEMVAVGCRIKSSGTKGIHLDPDTAGQFTMESCIISLSGEDGIYSLPPGVLTIEVTITNCVIRECQEQAIDMRGVAIGTISNSVFVNNSLGAAAWGVIIRDGNNISVIGNIMYDTQGTPTQAGIYVKRTSENVSLFGNVIINSATLGIHVDGEVAPNLNSNVNVIGNIVIDSGETGIRTDNETIGVSISNNYVYNPATSYGIWCWSDNAIVNGNMVYDAVASNGIYISADNVEVSSNRIYSANSDGIKLSSSNYCAVFGNHCSHNGGNGIQDDSSSANNVVKGNYCHSNTRNGVRIRHDNNIVRDNECISNTEYGIYIASTSDATIVKGNILSGNGFGPIYNLGTNTIRRDNVGDREEIFVEDDMFNPVPSGFVIYSEMAWDYDHAVAGTMTKADEIGGAVTSKTGPGINENNTIHTGTAFPSYLTRYPTIVAGLQAKSVIAHELAFGLYKDVDNYILFTSDDNGHIFARCNSAAVETAVDTGVVQDGSHKYYKIEVIDDNSVNFYLSASSIESMTWEANISTNVYAGTTQPYINHETTENFEKELDVTVIHHRQVR